MKDGWQIKKLGEVCRFQNGFAFKSNLFTKAGEPIIRISDIQNEQVCVDNLVYFNLGSYKEDLSRFVVYPNDILIAMSGGTTGKLGINRTGKKFYLNQRVGVFREDKNILDHRYLFYYLHTKSNESLRIAAGAAQPNLSTAQINAFEIPIPSLPEQQRIVNLLDAEFAKIDALKANAEKNLQNAKDLFQAALKKELEPKVGWKKTKLGDVCNYHKEQEQHSHLKYIGMENIESGTGRLLGFQNGSEILSTTFKFQSGYVMYGRLRPYLKKVFVAEFEGCCSTEIYPIETKEVLPRLLMYWFLSDTITDRINATCSGCRMPRANMNEVLDFDISLPLLSEQKHIIDRLDALNEKCKTLQANYKKTLTLCDDLKQALLRKAFDGEK